MKPSCGAWRACASFDPAGGPLVMNWLLVITAHRIDMVKGAVPTPPGWRPSRPTRTTAGGLSDIDRLDPALGCETPGQHRRHHRDA